MSYREKKVVKDVGSTIQTACCYIWAKEPDASQGISKIAVFIQAEVTSQEIQYSDTPKQKVNCEVKKQAKVQN